MQMKLWKKTSRWTWLMTYSGSLRSGRRMLWTAILQVPTCKPGSSKSLTTRHRSSLWTDRATSMKESAKLKTRFSQIAHTPSTSSWLRITIHSTMQGTHETRLNSTLIKSLDLDLQCSVGEHSRGAHPSMDDLSLSLMSISHTVLPSPCVIMLILKKVLSSQMESPRMSLSDAWLRTDLKKRQWLLKDLETLLISK